MRSLTHASDRLPAIAGIAKRVGQRLEAGAYLAGILRTQLPLALLWHTSPTARNPASPTWSWASVMGPIYHPDNMYLSLYDSIPVELTEVEMAYQTPGAMHGKMTSGRLTLRGPVMQADWEMPTDYHDYSYDSMRTLAGDRLPWQTICDVTGDDELIQYSRQLRVDLLRLHACAGVILLEVGAGVHSRLGRFMCVEPFSRYDFEQMPKPLDGFQCTEWQTVTII